MTLIKKEERKPECFLLLQRWRRRTNSSETSTSSQNPVRKQSLLSLLPPAEVNEYSSDNIIASDYEDLYQSIVTHVRQFYTDSPCQLENLRIAIAPIAAGPPLPSRQISILLSDSGTRLGALILCISWTILSRCLLLKLGMSNSPGSTFLPPEIVESFQSFSFGRIVTESGLDDHSRFDWALLSRWKQITAALMHSTYVTNGFSLIDSRTANIERALMDLDPLLRMFAIPGTTTRVSNLRDILKKGARFAFTLYGEPCVWQFEWEEDQVGALEYFFHGRYEDIDPLDCRFDPSKVVIWPALYRVIDSEGQHIREGERELGKKKFIGSFYSKKSQL